MKIKFYLKFFHLFAEKERRTRISYSFNDKGGKTKRFRTRFARSTNYIPGASSAQARTRRWQTGGRIAPQGYAPRFGAKILPIESKV